MTSTPTWPSEEFSLSPAPTFSSATPSDDPHAGAPVPGMVVAADPTPATRDEPIGAATDDAAIPQVAAPEIPAEPLLDPAELVAARAQIADLQTRLANVEEENRAFMQSLRHVAAAAEELLAEARTEAAALRAELERDTASAHAELDARRASIIVDSQREADRLLAESRATAHELVVVARADAREAVHQERRRAADDLEMLAALRERIADERNTLSQFHTQLSGRLRYLMTSMLEFAEQNPALELGDPSSFAATVLTGPQPTRSIALSAGVELPDADRAATASPSKLEGDMHGDEAHLDRAFDAFFSNDIDEDPSRRWILED